jgi:hypothetical protein
MYTSSVLLLLVNRLPDGFRIVSAAEDIITLTIVFVSKSHRHIDIRFIYKAVIPSHIHVS